MKSKDPNKKNKIVEKNINISFSFKSNLTRTSFRSVIGSKPSEDVTVESRLEYINDLK